jgi:hypothetical protein
VDGEIRWERVFPYGGREVRVVRLRHAWRLGGALRPLPSLIGQVWFDWLLRRYRGSSGPLAHPGSGGCFL